MIFRASKKKTKVSLVILKKNMNQIFRIYNFKKYLATRKFTDN